jgi:hypothetical protein
MNHALKRIKELELANAELRRECAEILQERDQMCGYLSDIAEAIGLYDAKATEIIANVYSVVGERDELRKAVKP